MFGYKNHMGIDRAPGLIRTWDARAANAHDGARLPVLISRDNTASRARADTAYRFQKNEAFLAKDMSPAISTSESRTAAPCPTASPA